MAWPILIGAALLAGAAAAGTPADEEVVAPAEVLALAPEQFERLTVAVHIMGAGPYQFIVDTGAQATVISNILADELQLGGRKTATLVGLNSQRPVEVAPIPALSLGSRTFPVQQAALVAPFNIGAADGILGLDSLQHQRVLFDFQEQSITITDVGNGRAGYDIVVRARRRLGQLIIADARIDGVRTAVIIDTGAQGSVGNAELGRRLSRARTMGSTKMTDINGIEREGDVRIARSLLIDRARLDNLPITFADSPTFRTLDLEDRPALLLGMSALRLFNRVAIDFSTREVLFDVPREAVS